MKTIYQLRAWGFWLLLCAIVSLLSQTAYAESAFFVKAVAADGSLWGVVGNNEINHRTQDGRMVAAFMDTAAGKPALLAPADDGSLWVVNEDTLVQFGAFGKPLTTPQRYCLQHFSADGALIASICKQGIEQGQFDYINNLQATSDGSLWVLDHSSARIQHFQADGAFIQKFTRVESGQNSLAINFTDDVGHIQPLPKSLLGLYGMTIGADGQIWQVGLYSLKHLNPDGTLIGQYSSDELLFEPFSDYILDAKGGIWVQSRLHLTQPIQKLDTQTTPLKRSYPVEYEPLQAKYYVRDINVDFKDSYDAVFQQQNGKFVLLSSSLTTRSFNTRSAFDSSTNVLIVRSVDATRQYFTAKLKHLGEYVFELECMLPGSLAVVNCN